MNRAMGELDSDKEEIELKWRRRGRHSCLAVEICERVRSAQGVLEVIAGQRGQVTLKQHSSVIRGCVVEGCEGLACSYRAQMDSEVS